MNRYRGASLDAARWLKLLRGQIDIQHGLAHGRRKVLCCTVHFDDDGKVVFRLPLLHTHCRGVVAAVEDGPGFGASDQREHAARAGAPGDPLVDELRRLLARGPRRPDQRPGVAQHLVADWHARYELLKSENVLAGHYAVDAALLARSHAARDLPFLWTARIIDADVEQEAVELGVIEEGHGYWHRPLNGPDLLYFYYGMGGSVLDDEGNLVFDKQAALDVYTQFADARARGVMDGSHLGIAWVDWHTAVAPGEKVLFATGGTWFWFDWALNYVGDRGGEDYLWDNIGVALVPAMKTGKPITLTHPLAYMISSSSKNVDVAMALLAAVTTPEANNRHAIGSAHLGILNAQLASEEYQNARFLSLAHAMLDYTTFIPNHPNWGAWSEAYWTGIQSVESGELSPEAALDVVVSRLQNEIPDIIIR